MFIFVHYCIRTLTTNYIEMNCKLSQTCASHEECYFFPLADRSLMSFNFS